MTRHRPAILMLLLLLSAAPLPAAAEPGMYRVEVLVFRHLDSDPQPVQVDQIRAFAEFPEPGEPLAPEAPVKLDVMSSAMQDVWRRLRLSAGFEPLLFTAWEQSRPDYHPPLRVHGEELIAEQLYFPGGVARVDLQSAAPFEEYLAPYYRLDGTVQLQRSRFLHLILDLEFRQDLLPRPQALPEGREAALRLQAETPIEVLGASPGPARVFPLRQSRQVRIGEMNYFDSSYLGVLARVTTTSGQ
jgi:hypothetical protein